MANSDENSTSTSNNPPKPPRVGAEIITKGADPKGVERKIREASEKRDSD